MRSIQATNETYASVVRYSDQFKQLTWNTSFAMDNILKISTKYGNCAHDFNEDEMIHSCNLCKFSFFIYFNTVGKGGSSWVA